MQFPKVHKNIVKLFMKYESINFNYPRPNNK